MTTFQSLLPAYLDAHSWLLQTPGLWKLGDWPELTGRSVAQGFLVQYALADELFPEDGMRQAHQILESLHGRGSYTGSFWPGGHVFTAAMQREAISYLSTTLRAAGSAPDHFIPYPPLSHNLATEDPDDSATRFPWHPLTLQRQAKALLRQPSRALRSSACTASASGICPTWPGLKQPASWTSWRWQTPIRRQEGTLGGSVAVFDTLDQLLASESAPDVVILATPIQTHAPLALAALAAGADVYVEKPPVASMAQFQEVLAAAEASGRWCRWGSRAWDPRPCPRSARPSNPAKSETSWA